MNTAATDYSNHRKHRRVYLGTDIAVYDVLNGDRVGEIVNITIEGLMLVMEQEPEAGNIYQFAMSMPQDLDGHKVINVGADCLWCSPSSISGQHWAGFQIIDASETAETLIQHLIDTYGTD